MPTAFLSHSSVDKPVVRRIGDDLKRLGIDSWIDEAEIHVGESLVTKIAEAIENIDVVVAVLSKSSVTSQWVRKELEWAMTREIESTRILVLPVIIERVDVPLYMRDKLYLDMSRPEEYDKGIERLARDIRYHLGVEAPPGEQDIVTGQPVVTTVRYKSPALILNGALAIIACAIMISLYLYEHTIHSIPNYSILLSHGLTFGIIVLALCAADVLRVLLLRAGRETNPRLAADFNSVPWTSLVFKTYRTVIKRHIRSPYILGILVIEILTTIGILVMINYAFKIIRFALSI